MNEEALVPQDPAFADVQDMFKTADGQKEFIEWFHHPVTRKLLLAARVIAKPKPPSGAKSSDYMLGEACGKNEIIDFFIGPQNFVPRAPVKLRATYPKPEIQKEADDA